VLRIALGAVLVAASIALIAKADAQATMISIAVATLVFGTLFVIVLRKEVRSNDRAIEQRPLLARLLGHKPPPPSGSEK
jgi:hypothetical protein